MLIVEPRSKGIRIGHHTMYIILSTKLVLGGDIIISFALGYAWKYSACDQDGVE